MSTWFSRVADRLEALLNPGHGPWGPYPAESRDIDADLRRVSRELDAIRVRFADHR